MAPVGMQILIQDSWMGPESPVSSKLEGIPSRGPIPSGSPPRLLGGRCLSMIWSLLETWTPGPHPDPRGKGESPGELYAHQGLRSPGAQCIFGVRRAGRAVSAGAPAAWRSWSCSAGTATRRRRVSALTLGGPPQGMGQGTAL